MSNQSERPEKWQRLLDAAKASASGEPAAGSQRRGESAPEEFSATLIGRLRTLHASLSSWKRWSLIAGLISLLVFLASLIYLKLRPTHHEGPMIAPPRLEIPNPAPTNDRQP